MSDANRAVFLSYASQDAAAARRIAEALRAAGVEVWFDQNELVGGDAWDKKIRGQISSCALFVPIISANTNARSEGYFRLEWKLAVDRSHLLADDHPFLFPIVIGEVSDAAARVPDKFREVQWTRLDVKQTPESLATRVAKLLSREASAPAAGPTVAGMSTTRRAPSKSWVGFAWAGVGLAFALTYGLRPLWQPERPDKAGRTEIAAGKTAALTPAQELVAKARAILDQNDEMNREGYTLAEELLKKAEALDPTEASAWALHATLSANLVWFAFDITSPRLEAMRVQASRALTLAPNSDEARLAELRVRIELDQAQADSVRDLQEIVRRSPDNWQAWRVLSRSLRKQSDADGALAAMQRAWQLSSNDPSITSDLVNHLTNVGQFAEAERVIREQTPGKIPVRLLAHDLFMEIYWRGNPQVATDNAARWPSWFLVEDRGAGHAALAALWNRDSGLALRILARYPRDYLTDYLYTGPRAVLTAWANEQAGNEEAALADWKIARQVTERTLREFPDDREALYWKAWALARLGDRPGATAIVRLLEQREARGNGLFIFGGLAGLKAALGDIEGAVDLLAKVRVNLPLNIKPVTQAFLTLNPVFDPLRGNARFQALVAAAPGPEEKKPSSPASGSVSAPSDKSVAVLAFANLSDDKGNEYFSDGISEELLNVLAKVPGLKVTARTSSFHFKGKDTPIPEIAQQLGVAYVIEGSVRKQGGKVRITAQLIKAADGFHVWSDTFTRDLKDIFAVQDEIAGLIAKNLSLRLGIGHSAKGQATSPEAFELYLRGRAAWNLRTREGYTQAEILLGQAIDLDPEFARAHAALADVWIIAGYENEIGGGTYGWRNSPTVAKVFAKAEQALALDPDCAEAYTTLALALEMGWKHDAAARAYQHAVELNPNYATARHWFGMFVWGQGKMDDALRELKQAAELDPLSHRILDTYARALNQAGRSKEALAFADRALALHPMAIQAATQKAHALALLGRTTEAVALIEKVLALEPNAEQRAEALIVLQFAGAKTVVRRVIGSVADLPHSPFKFASQIALGQVDEALSELRLADIHEDQLISMEFSRFYDPARGDPRFLQAIRDVDFADNYRRAREWLAANPPQRQEAIK